MMASRIYRKLSCYNFMSQSLSSKSSFYHQRSLTSSNFTSHEKLDSLNPPFAQNLIKPYSQNPTPTRPNNLHSDYSSSSSQLLFVSNLTPKSLAHSRKFQNPYGKSRFVSTCNPRNESSETPSENYELKHQEMRGTMMKSVYHLNTFSARFVSTSNPPRSENSNIELKHQEMDGDVAVLERVMRNVYRFSMVGAGIGLLNLGWGAWISYSVQNSVIPEVSILGLLGFGVPFSLAFTLRRGLKGMELIKKMIKEIQEQGLRIITLTVNVNKGFSRTLFAPLLGVLCFGFAASMLRLVYIGVSNDFTT